MMIKPNYLWYYFYNEYDAIDKEYILANLINPKFELKKLDLNNCKGIGILFITEASLAFHKFINKVSLCGMDKILVIGKLSEDLNYDFSWTLLQSGVSDVIYYERSDRCINKIIARLKRWIEIEEIMNSRVVCDHIIGESKICKNILRKIIDIAYYSDSSVLISGESGTGKELIAHLINNLDPKHAKKNLVILDCSTIVPELSGSEFFGHERGAFTGAVTSRDGAFALANEGTLFLDEVGELPVNLQAQLLRVIQEHTYKRVGGNSWHSTGFRLICATNKDLKKEVQKGTFRSDLYYRIAQWTCRLPPLRERLEDIIPLAEHFSAELLRNKSKPKFDKTVTEYLLKRKYPGNIRDLKQTVSRIMHNYLGYGPVTIGDIPVDELTADFKSLVWPDGQLHQNLKQGFTLGLNLKDIIQIVENSLIDIALSETNGSVKAASKKLGVTTRTIQNKRAIGRGDKNSEVTFLKIV